MSYAYSRKSYPSKSEVKSGSPSQAIEDSKKKSSLLKDNSWIRKNEEEDEPVDRDPNFGRTVLSRGLSNEYLDSKQASTATDSSKTPAAPKTTNTSVQSLSKRFGGSQDQLSSPSSPTSYDKAAASRSSELKPTVTGNTKTSVTTKTSPDSKTTETTVTTTSSSTRTPVTKRPSKTETFTERVFSDVKSAGKVKPSTLPPKPSKANDATNPEVTSSKGPLDSLSDTLIPKPTQTVYSSSKRTSSLSGPNTTEVTTVTTTKENEKDWPLDSLSDTLIPKPTQTVYSSSKRTSSVSSPNTTEVTTVTTTKENEKDWPLDSLSDTLIPKPTQTVYSSSKRTSSVSSPNTTEVTTVTTTKENEKDWPLDLLSDTFTTKPSRTVYSTPDRDYSKPYTVSSPSSTTTTTTSTRSSTRTYSGDYSPPTKTSSYSVSTEPSYSYSIGTPTRSSYSRQPSDTSSPLDSLSDAFNTKPSVTSYSTSDRTVLGKNVCTCCRQHMNTEPKIILNEMDIHCHASCFKCEVCNGSLGHLKAGDSMWIYQRTVHCERCFEGIREKWHR